MFESAFWGLIQGLTEFLPVSSSGHLVLIPALLGLDEPGLEITAVLHLGTLAAVVVYFWRDLVRALHFRTDPYGRRVLVMLMIGTIPAAVVGLAGESMLEDLFENPRRVAVALIVTGLILLATRFLPDGRREVKEGSNMDALLVGVAQAAALIPGISRSGVTMSAGMGRQFSRQEAARLAFLLGVPAIAGAGVLQARDLADQGGLTAEVLVGAVVAGLVGYASIAWLLRLLGRSGLSGFGIYCVALGVFSLIVL